MFLEQCFPTFFGSRSSYLIGGMVKLLCHGAASELDTWFRMYILELFNFYVFK